MHRELMASKSTSGIRAVADANIGTDLQAKDQ